MLIYVPGKLFVTGDVAATAANILANQSSFQAYIVIRFFAVLLRRVGKKRVNFNIYDKLNVSCSIMVSDRIRGEATDSEDE